MPMGAAPASTSPNSWLSSKELMAMLPLMTGMTTKSILKQTDRQKKKGKTTTQAKYHSKPQKKKTKMRGGKHETRNTIGVESNRKRRGEHRSNLLSCLVLSCLVLSSPLLSSPLLSSPLLCQRSIDDPSSLCRRIQWPRLCFRGRYAVLLLFDGLLATQIRNKTKQTRVADRKEDRQIDQKTEKREKKEKKHKGG